MRSRCPHCASPEVGLGGGAPDLCTCEECGATFQRVLALVAVADAEAQLCPPLPTQALFHLDPAKALESINDPDGALWPVNAYSDADELNALADDALTAGIVGRERPGAHFALYPMSLAEPDPVLAVNLGNGRVLLGHSLKLREREGESPIDFTLRLLEDMTSEANALAASRHPDSARLDRIASYMNRPGHWKGADVCEFVAKELRESGREIADEP